MAIVCDESGTAGKVCRVCGEWKPLDGFSPKRLHGDGYHNQCKACRNAIAKADWTANRDKRIARQHELYAENIEERRAKQRKYKAAHRDQVNQVKRAFWHRHKERINYQRRKQRAENPEPARRASRAYSANHREQNNAYARAWRAENPDKVRALNRNYYLLYRYRFFEYGNRRRALKRQAEGSHTEAEWEILKAYYAHTCLRCGRREPEITLTRDHIIPLSEGGSDDVDNLQPLCFSCNSSKSTKTIDYRASWRDGQARDD